MASEEKEKGSLLWIVFWIGFAIFTYWYVTPPSGLTPEQRNSWHERKEQQYIQSTSWLPPQAR